MAITVGGTAITFNDGSTQSTAGVSLAGISTFDSIGSFAVAYLTESPGFTGGGPGYNFKTRGLTVAGSSLRVNSRASGLASPTSVEAGMYGPLSAITSPGAFNTFPTTNTVTLSGTWRLMASGAQAVRLNDTYGWTGVNWYPMLWVRIS